MGDVSGLLSQDEVVVLLTALYEQVAVSDELSRGDEVIGAGDLLLVHAHTTRGDELAQLALRGEDCRIFGEEVDDLHTTLQLVLRDFELGYPLKDGEECSFVE